MLINVLKFAVARGAPGLLNLLAILYFTRQLGPELYGKYIIIVSYGMLFSTIVYQWLKSVLIRFYNDDEYSSNSVSYFVFWLVKVKTLIIIIFNLIFYLLTGFSFEVIAVSLFVITHSFYELNLELERARGSASNYAFISTFKAVSALLIGGGLLYLGYGYYSVLVGLILSYLLPILFNFFSYWLLLNKEKINGYALFKFGAPLTMTFAMSFIISFSDRIMIERLLGANQVGVYTASQDIVSQSIVLLFSVLNIAIYPHLINSSSCKVKLTIEAKNAFRIIFGIAFPLVYLLFSYRAELFSLLLSKDFYSESLSLLPIFILSSFILAIRVFYFDLKFQLFKETKYQLYVLITAAILNVALNYFFINSYGLVGAAYSSLLTSIYSLIMSIFVGTMRFKMPIDTLFISCVVLISFTSTFLVKYYISMGLYDILFIGMFYSVLAFSYYVRGVK